MTTLKIFFWAVLIIFIALLGFLAYKNFLFRDDKKIELNVPSPTAVNEKCLYNKFKWGIGIAPYDLAGVDSSEIHDWEISKPILDLAKELGVSYVRIGIPTWAMERQEELILPVVKYANELGLAVMLGFDPPQGNPVKLGDLDRYQDGLKWGKEIGELYKEKICYYQVSNEVTGTAIKPSWAGITPDDFDDEKYRQVFDWVKGASVGLNETDPGVRRVITGHWLGFGIFERMIKDNLNFEAIGWDWYDRNYNLEKVVNEAKSYNLTKELSKFKKELMIVEAGAPDGSQYGEDQQADYLRGFAQMTRQDPRYYGFFPLTLTDWAPPAGQEPSYGGLVEVKKENNQWILSNKKKAFYDYQKIIQDMK